MSPIDQLAGLQRRLNSSRELTDLLIIETLELCCLTPLEDLPKKYVLMDLCHSGAWEQAALWVMNACLPSWTLELKVTTGEAKARVLSRHRPPFTFEVTSSRTAQAILGAIIQAVLILTKLKLNSKPR